MVSATSPNGQGNNRLDEQLAANAATVYAMNTIIDRLSLMGGHNLGDDRRDLNKEAGYPEAPNAANTYKPLYRREGVARRVVDIWPDECWRYAPNVYQTEEQTTTAFEETWEDIVAHFNVNHILHRVDRASGIGQYGLLLFGLDDAKPLNEPVENVAPDGSGKRAGGKDLSILYMRVFDESQAEVVAWEQNETHPRFGQPTIYQLRIADPMGGDGAATVKLVHWTRVLHIADNRESSEWLGCPRMEPCLNRILDIRKILAGAGEMFYRGGFPGLDIRTQRPTGANTLPPVIDVEATRQQLELYMNRLQRYLISDGTEAHSLTTQIADPTANFMVCMNYIAVTIGVPLRVLMGTEEAKLASTQDKNTWNERVMHRQNTYISPMLLRPFIDRLIQYGQLPEVDEYSTTWDDLNTSSERDNVELAKLATDALARYVEAGLHEFIPPMEFLTHIMKFELDVAEAIIEAAGGEQGLAAAFEEEEELDETADDETADDVAAGATAV